MGDVKQYTFTLFCCSLAIALMEFIVHDSCKKQISYITGMVILIAVLSPLTYLFRDIGKAEIIPVNAVNHYSVTNDILAEQFKYNLSKIINDKLMSEGIFAEDIRIQITMSDSEIELGIIEVVISPECGGKADDTRYTLEEMLKIKVAVVIAGG